MIEVLFDQDIWTNKLAVELGLHQIQLVCANEVDVVSREFCYEWDGESNRMGEKSASAIDADPSMSTKLF